MELFSCFSTRPEKVIHIKLVCPPQSGPEVGNATVGVASIDRFLEFSESPKGSTFDINSRLPKGVWIREPLLGGPLLVLLSLIPTLSLHDNGPEVVWV
jgi:hypothetical protein